MNATCRVLVLAVLTAITSLVLPAQTLNPFSTPDFEAYFPDNIAGAEVLASEWNARAGRDRKPSLETIRQGFRRYKGDRSALLQWAGRTFIEEQSPQDPAAVDIMYHALDIGAQDDSEGKTRSAAIRFGLSAVRPMTSNILHALAEASMDSENADDLDRIVWGIDGQRDEALRVLKPYLEDADAAVREKAAAIQRVWNREIKAHDWVREMKRERAEKMYGSALPDITQRLISGTSAERKQTLDSILQNEILLILPDSALQCFTECASDPNPDVRALAARLAGERWILTAAQQHPAAVDLMYLLSRDDSEAVCYNAVYYGLSAASPKDTEVIGRLLEVAWEHPETELYERIAWGIRTHRPQLQTVLSAWIDSKDQERAAAGRALYRDLIE